MEKKSDGNLTEGSVESNDYELIGASEDDLEGELLVIPLREVVNLKDSGLPGPAYDDNFRSFRSSPLSQQEFQSLFDKEGRITDEHTFRHKVFRGGIDPSIRPDVWCYLFGVYPCHSTEKEREALKTQKVCQYYALKKRWQSALIRKCPTFDLLSSDNFLIDGKPVHVGSSEQNHNAIMASVHFLKKDIFGVEAEIFGSRTACPDKLLHESLRFISKDVPRTDRSHPFFAGKSPNLLRLRDALMTASLLSPEVGYVQGMNDIMARFLFVFDSEPIAFWCFHYYIKTVQRDFLSEGMLLRINMLQDLLKELDPDLFQWLKSKEVSELIFCHKWLLLCFQREFTFPDGLRILEILSSHHLELYAPQGLHAREESRRILQQKGANFAVDAAPSDFSFDLFVAAAILTLFRNKLFSCLDGCQAFQFVSSLSGQLQLDDVLCQAEKLFYAYCHKSVTDAFLLI